MPTNSPPKSSDDILQDILEGNYTKFTSLADFKTILNQILIDIECEDSQNKQNFLNFECGSPEGKNLGTHFFLQSTLGKGLNNIFDLNAEFIILNKDNLSDDIIKKLILLGTHYTTMYEVKINEVNSSFNENDIITTSSFLNFVTSLFNIPNITEFETPRLIHTKGENIFPNITFGDPQRIDTLIGDTIKLSEDLTHILEYKKYNYKKESLFDFLESLGRFGFELKIKEDFQDYSHKIPEIANKTIWSTNLINFSKEDRELAGRSFLAGFYDKNENQIKSECVHLLGLEDCPRPATASTRLFQQIAQGNYINQKPSFADFVQVESEIKDSIDTLDRDQNIHILTFLKNVLKTNNGSKNTFNFKNLYGFAFNSIDKLSRDLQQKNMLDDSFSQAAESLSFFLFNIVKNNVNNQDLLDQIHIVTQFSKLYENIIVHAPHLNSLSYTMGNHLFSILARNIDSLEALQTGHRDFIKIIKDLNQVCIENRDACNLAKILAGSFKSLGSISRKSSGYALNATREAKALIESTRGNINPEQLSDAVSFFFKANISQPVLNRKCREIFNLTGCRPANFIDLDNLAYGEIDEITTTLLPEDLIDTNVTMPAPQIIANAAVAPAINQTVGHQGTSTFSPISFPETPSTTEIITAITQDLGSKLPSATEIGSTAAHSFGSGLLNLMTQATSIWLRNKGYGKSIISGLSLSLASGILQASYVATFPLMLFKLNQLVAQGNEAEAQAQWEMMTQEMLPVFFTSLTLSSGLQLLNYLSENYLSKQLTLKGLIQSIPTLSSLWSFSRNPILTGIHAGTAYVVSSIGLAGFNRFFSARNNRKSDIEVNRNIVEMENLTKESNNKELETNTKKTEPARTFKYLTEENLESVRENSRKLKTSLEKFISLLQKSRDSDELFKVKSNNKNVINEYEKSITDKNHVLELLKEPFNMVNILHERLMDKNHDEACRVYTDFAVYNKVIGETGNVFKLMQGFYETTKGNNNLRDALSKLYGFVEGRTENFDSGTLQTLEEMHASLDTLLSPVRGFVSAYNTADAAYQGEKRGEVKANLLNGGNITSTLLRQKKSVEAKTSLFAANNRRFTFSGDSDNSRTSTASDESDKSGNSAYNPIDPQQETPLLNGTTYRV